MERRNFLKQNMLATGALFGTTSLMASNSNNAAKKDALMENTSPFKCNYAFHDGMFKNTAGPDFIEQIKYAHSMGFRSIEDNGMMGRTPEMQQKIGDTLASLGMNMGVFVIAFSNNDKINLTTGTQEWKDKFVQTCKESVEVAKRCNAKWMTVVPGNYDRKLPIGIQTGNVIDGLRLGTEVLEKNNLTGDDIAWLVPHQANLRIIDATANRMGLPKEKVMINIQKYGNTTAATIPLCLWEWESQLKKGDNLILAAFGGGFTWGAAWVKWAY